MVLHRHGQTNPGTGKFDWKDTIIDAGIMAGLTFFTTLGGIGASGLLTDMKLGIIAAGISSGSEFFLILAIKRKLKEKK